MTARCRRSDCGRILRSPSSVARGYGRTCWLKERAEKRDAAIELAVIAWSDRQKAAAKDLIRAGRLKPTKRPGLYEITSSDKVTVYLTTAMACPCRARGLCYHRAAAAIFDAYREVA